MSRYTIGGVNIEFPCRAYPSQLAMMNAILRGLNTGQHCLLESPTGSGKSLALLCSALGWQQAQKEQQQQAQKEQQQQQQQLAEDISMHQKPSDAPPSCQCLCHSKVSSRATAAEPDILDITVSPAKDTPGRPQLSVCCSPAEVSLKSDDDDDDFLPDQKRRWRTELKSRKKPRLDKGVIFIDDETDRGSTCSSRKKPRLDKGVIFIEDETDRGSTCSNPEPCSRCPCAKVKDVGVPDVRKKIPKIFFGTRTHKQITQIAHELRRTVYSAVPMTILSSRDHTCVNPEVAPHSNRNERCKDLLEAKDGRSCHFYHGVLKMRDRGPLHLVHGLDQAWDIEDLVSAGRRLRCCSYYTARELMSNALIVFCPYNYLLDPLIRESMEIDLRGQVVVLDEAHNIEDCARESSSYSVDLSALQVCRDELDNMISSNVRRCQHQSLHGFCCSLISWIQESQVLMCERGFESACKVWTGTDVLVLFRDLGITSASFNMLKEHLAVVLEKEDHSGKEAALQLPTISSAASSVLKGLFMVLDFLFRHDCRFASDYRVALQKSYTWTNKAPPDVADAQGFFFRQRPRQRQSVRMKTEVLTTFSDLSGSVHSIVLTSGTLSPMTSFSSELGVKFTIQLEANHVIDKSQVWVGTVGAGPGGRQLRATFQHTETFTFQDEVGALLLHVCQVVAKGVLCFLPSYKMLDKLQERWSSTGLWDKLQTHKVVVTEPRGGSKTDFDQLLQSYYDAIKYSEDQGGALLIAVCRGKVSEGLDFTDDNARAVVTIGIPFPNIKDLQVELKMKYNDQHCRSRGLLPGHRWYEIQAYRALNQALGRCIRHRKDWGALILVDDRFGNNPQKYITGLSKWVRQLVQHHATSSVALHSLDVFCQWQQDVVPVETHTVSVKSPGPEGGSGPLQSPVHPSPSVVNEPRPPQDRSPAPPTGPTAEELGGRTPNHSSCPSSSGLKTWVIRGPKAVLTEDHQVTEDSDTKGGPLSLDPEPPAAPTPPIPPHKDLQPASDSEDEDQTIFYTPELFSGDEEDSSPLKGTDPKSLSLGSVVLLAEEPGPGSDPGSASSRTSVSSVS